MSMSMSMRNFDKPDGEEGLPVISMSEETPDNLCIAFLDLSYCRPIASLIQVLIYHESSTSITCNHMILQKKSLLPLVGRAAKLHSIVLPGEGGASSAFARLCPNQLPVYNNQAVHAVSVACRVRGKIALSQSPRVPESQSPRGPWSKAPGPKPLAQLPWPKALGPKRLAQGPWPKALGTRPLAQGPCHDAVAILTQAFTA